MTPMASEPLVVSTADTEETLALGRRLALAARTAGVERLVLDLRGELGAGKTVFVRGLGAGLGMAAGQAVVSPTFTIARSYPVAAGALTVLHHIDAYRLAGPDELEAAGFEDMCGPGRVTSVEWGENVEEALPMDRLRIDLRIPFEGRLPSFDEPEVAREVTFRALGPESARVLAALRAAVGSSEATP